VPQDDSSDDDRYVTITLQSRFQDKSLPEMLGLHKAYKQRNREF